MKWDMSNFDSDPLTCDPAMFLAKKSPNSAKRNRIFSGKGRGDRALILKYLGSPMTTGGNGKSRLNQKCKFWIRPFSIKIEILQQFSKQCFFL